MQGDFAQLGVVFCHQDTLLGIEEGLLGFAHLYAREVAQHVALVGNVVVFLRCDEVLAFQGEQAQVVLVGLPEVGQVGT